MTKLTSKLQYNNFETGEFVEEKERTYEETIQLLEAFPWAAQRDHLLVGLTNPSITLQGESNDFLKLAVFFNNTFVLHYLNTEDALFTKSFTCFADAYPYIKNYFESNTFDTTDFRKENTWLQHNRNHFISQNFRYEVTSASAGMFLFKTSGLNFSAAVILIIIIIIKGTIKIQWIPTIIVFPYFFYVGGGLNLILFCNYYFYAKDKILIMSKGNDFFYYGDKDSPAKYNKQDILCFTTIQPRSGRNPVSSFAIIKVECKDSTIIKIPNIFVSSTALEQKLAGCVKIERGSFPYIKK